jgi:hypothetical protein
MSQELLFVLFLFAEMCFLIALYTFVIVPMNAKATVSRWETKMLNQDFDVVAMLDQYTEHLLTNLVEVVKKIVPEIMGGYLSAGTQQLKADPENILAVATSEFLEDLPLPARLVANKLLPKLQEALGQAGESQAEPGVRYQPGLDKR